MTTPGDVGAFIGTVAESGAVTTPGRSPQLAVNGRAPVATEALRWLT